MAYNYLCLGNSNSRETWVYELVLEVAALGDSSGSFLPLGDYAAQNLMSPSCRVYSST